MGENKSDRFRSNDLEAAKRVSVLQNTPFSALSPAQERTQKLWWAQNGHLLGSAQIKRGYFWALENSFVTVSTAIGNNIAAWHQIIFSLATNSVAI